MQRMINAVNTDRLMQDVNEITKYIRLSGTEEERKAFAYIKTALEKAGLETHMETVRAYISLPEKASLRVADIDFPCTTHSMLPSADLKADIVYIADAADISENSSGKVILTDGLAMYPFMETAQKHGAAAVIFIAGSTHVHEMIVSKVWGSPEPADLDKYIQIPAVTITYSDGEKLKSLIQTPQQASIHTEVSRQWVDLPLLTASIEGERPEWMIFTGHVDSWHYGAMDNASGNACALEIARILSGRKLKRGIKFVFWSGHSHGRYAGSAAFCDAYFNELYENCFMHINADCLGGCGANLLTQGGCCAETYALGARAIKAVTGEDYEGTRFSRSCDQSFWGTGTPSLFSSVSEQVKPPQPDAASKAFTLMFGGSKSGGYGWWWHTVADTCDKIDPALLTRDVQIFVTAVYDACTAPVMPVDIVAGFDEFTETIAKYVTANPSIADFSSVMKEISKTKSMLADAKSSDELIMAVEQILLPLMYVKNSIFKHDPAARHQLIPSLDVLNDISSLTADEQEAALVQLRRELNRIRRGVRDIQKLLA